MEVGMAPPHKRRKLSESDSRDGISFESEVGRPAPTPTFSHGVEHLSHAYATSDSRQVPPRIEEVHLQIHHQAVSVPDIHHGLHRRQGSGASSEPTLAVTVVASVNTDGSTTGLSTATDTAAASGVSSFASTATTTVISSPSPSDSTSTSSSTDATSSSSSTDATSSTSSDTISSTSYNSTGTVTPTSSSTSDPSSTAAGFIGISPTGSSPASASNNSSSGSVSLTGTVTSLSTGASLSGSLSQNLTTSALIIQDSRSHTTESSSKTLGAAFYLATLADGTVETFSRSSHSYITTFPDGSFATVPAATGSYVTATGTDGVTSVVYILYQQQQQNERRFQWRRPLRILRQGSSIARSRGGAGGGGGGSEHGRPLCRAQGIEGRTIAPHVLGLSSGVPRRPSFEVVGMDAAAAAAARPATGQGFRERLDRSRFEFKAVRRKGSVGGMRERGWGWWEQMRPRAREREREREREDGGWI
ncbi:hypothetical protein B0A55_01952 [Friedmanniomyces simplex]|uniref:Uncharacterized protein n=1 Tax=Friedmanniomyces simplex TaxID=329884 RepID=A0A4U0XIU2_9PEZI|nr:hypothetical protein B0A55_01952 [Friedmanniomyces simplex]